MNKTIISILTILGILVIGVAGFGALITLSPEPPRVERPKVVPLVSTTSPEVQSGSISIMGNGTVRATREINLVAEISGRVVRISPSAVSGGFFQQGTPLFTLDQSDYRNAVSIAEAEVTQRKYELLLAQEEVTVARDEWNRLQARRGSSEIPDSTDLGVLVFKEPQLRLAESLLKSAEARLEDARTRLNRTQVRAPFSGRIRTKLVDIGQYVAPGQAVASAYNTDQVEIPVPLQSSETALIGNLWQRETNRQISIPATVRATFGDRTYEWDGFVDRTEGTLDANTRTLNVVVKVNQPYKTTENGRPPLLVGMFSEVEIQGNSYDTYYVIPREALKENETVWVFNDGILEVRNVDIIQESEGKVYIENGLNPDERLITSTLDVFTDGMEIRTVD